MGFTFKSQSWASCCMNFPGFAVDHQPGIQLVTMEQDEPLPLVAAKCAWWQLDHGTVKDIAQEMGIGIAGGASPFDILFEATLKVLNCSEQEALDILAGRLDLLLKKS
eukprot:5577480-Lingulodinium_polyedra.AAC.1